MGKYFENSTTYSTTIGYYVVNFIYDKVTLNDYNNTDWQVLNTGKPLVKSE